MKQEFNVLEFNFTTRKLDHYDVLPYFRREWKSKKYDSFGKSKVKNKAQLKEWIMKAAHYQFWSRCEYEFLIGPWPYKEDKLKEELIKVDVFQQIMINIDIVTDILYKEFFKAK